MRILVLLDPTNKRGTKTPYTKLRKFLVSDGYVRIGAELFMRVVANRQMAGTHIRRLEKYDPGSGTVRVLELTEKQYQKIRYLTGAPDRQEEIVGANCHISL